MSHHSKRLLQIVFQAVALYLLQPQQFYFAYGDEAPKGAAKASVKDVVKAWTGRMSAAKTFDFRWRANEFQSADDMLLAQETTETGASAPPTSFVSHVRLALDASSRGRMDEDSETWSIKEGTHVKSQKRFAFDRGTKTLFFPVSLLGHPWATINHGDILKTVRPASAWAVCLSYRMLDPELRFFKEDDLQMTNDTGRYQGVDVLILKIGGQWKGTIWVDPTKDFIPVRLIGLDARTGTVQHQVDLSYTKDAGHGWVPTSWTWTETSPNRSLIEAQVAKVTEYHINEPLADSTFSIELPDGTWVKDQIANEEYILRNGGQKRPIARGEFKGDNYEALLNSDPKSASGK